jgi:uncharacterized protein YyaL (SSP411 family)
MGAASNVDNAKKGKFKQPKFPLETMEEFAYLEEKLRDSRYQRFMVSHSLSSLLLAYLITLLCSSYRLLGTEREHGRSWNKS